ncbi:hypothetical protein V2H45_23130 [Tumidithrix elongata RA019]|uniref:Uncharacterized protein n=1 Tax=Tumidithrix elongata BACA0141 TaxID=2716417 RepID=A0AAW9Q6S6_9CYAN|nr:hypothetical protein [Tumidithrix elongata RA019]
MKSSYRDSSGKLPEKLFVTNWFNITQIRKFHTISQGFSAIALVEATPSCGFNVRQ